MSIRELDIEKVFKAELSNLADNIGKVYVPLNINSDNYKLSYSRKSLSYESSAKEHSDEKSDIEVLGVTIPLTNNRTVEKEGYITPDEFNREEDKNESAVEYSISQWSDIEQSINEELNETDQTKLQNHFSLNITDSNSSFKGFSSLNSMQQHCLENGTIKASNKYDSAEITNSQEKSMGLYENSLEKENMNPQASKDLPNSRNIHWLNTRNETRWSSGGLSPNVNKKKDLNFLKNFDKSATVHSHMIPQDIGYTDSLIKSTTVGTWREQVRPPYIICSEFCT